MPSKLSLNFSTVCLFLLILLGCNALGEKPFPMEDSQYTELSTNSWMQTSVTVGKNGIVLANTRTWTGNNKPFRGCLAVYLKVQGKIVPPDNGPICYRVQKQGSLFGKNDRRDLHEFNYSPPEIVSITDGIEIHHATEIALSDQIRIYKEKWKAIKPEIESLLEEIEKDFDLSDNVLNKKQ